MNRLFQRITRIVTSQIHASVDSAENPELIMKQTLREMRDDIANVKQDVIRAIASKNIIKKELEREEAASHLWQKRAETAVENTSDHLAREALLRKREHENAAAALSENLKKATDTCDVLKSHLKRMERQMEEANRNFLSLISRQRSARARKHLTLSTSRIGTETTWENELLQMTTRINELEADADAIMELEDDKRSVEHHIDTLSRDTAIDNELEALKQAIKARNH